MPALTGPTIGKLDPAEGKASMQVTVAVTVDESFGMSMGRI